MAQSAELAGGAGFKFEDLVGATYLVSLLRGSVGAGTEDRRVTRVGFQQRDFGEPLDDLIIDSEGQGDDAARLSLQIKSTLTVSAAQTNADFRAIIRDCLATLRKADFRLGSDRFGAVAGSVARESAEDLRRLVEAAKGSPDLAHFEKRFAPGGNASEKVRALKLTMKTLLDKVSGEDINPDELHRFLAHFVLIEFDFRRLGSTALAEALNALTGELADELMASAPLVWAKLCQLAGKASTSAGVFDRGRLVGELQPTVRLKGATWLRNDLRRVSELSAAWVADIENDVGGVHLDRPKLREELALQKQARLVQVRGLPGSGKSVLLRSAVEAELAQGPTLFLKHDRLDGRGWTSFATANGLSPAPLVDLLIEIGATGSAVLFIDGIDRIESEHQGVVTDVLRALADTPDLAHWRIVMGLRDSGIAPLRNWLGWALDAFGVATVDVAELSDDEAEALAVSQPLLKSMALS